MRRTEKQQQTQRQIEDAENEIGLKDELIGILGEEARELDCAEHQTQDAEQHGEVRQVEEGQPAEPAPEGGQAHAVRAVLEPRAGKQRAQPAPKDAGEQQGSRQTHRQVVLLHHRDEERVDVVVSSREEHLVEIRVELAVKGKARN